MFLSCFRRLSSRTVAAYAVIVALSFTLVGCRSDQPKPKYSIVVIPKGMTHEFWQSIHRGALRAKEELAKEGIEIEVFFNGPLRERDILDQISIVDRRIASGVSGIVLAPQHSRIMTAPVKRAVEENIPVVIIDSGLADQDLMVKYVATDNYNGGWLAAEHLWSVLESKGILEPRIILLRYQIGSESTEQREQGFLDYFDSNNHNRKRKLPPPKKVTWVSTDKYAGATRDSASREAAPLVQQYKDQVDAIFAPNESSASGTLDVLRSQGLNKKILVMGFDSSQPLLQAIQEGDIVGSIIQDPYFMGYLSVYTLVRYLEGDDVTDGRKNMSQSTGEHLVTKENVDKLETVERYNAEKQSQRTMPKPTFPKRTLPSS
jgi:ribose transport system substrate-binding protein